MARFLRLVGRSGIRLDRQGGKPTIAGRGEIDAALLADALSRGLLVQSGDRLGWTAETASFLRREALASGQRAISGPVAGASDPHADQHREIETVRLAGLDLPVRINRLAGPLGALSRLKDKAGAPFFSAEALAAAERLAADFHHGGLSPRVTMAWSAVPAGRPQGAAPRAPDLADTTLAARQRVGHAARAIGPELAGVVIDACCFDKGLETIERERGWPARSAKLMLRAGLMALVRHYEPKERQARRQRHVWHERSDAG